MLLLLASCAGDESSNVEQVSYAQHQEHQMRSLTEDEVERYLKGEGMGFARVAEINHYPGPMHVLDLAEELELTEEQREAVRKIFERMQAEAKRLGREYVDHEQEIDSLFANEQDEAFEVQELIRESGAILSELRFVHVHAHMETREVVTPEQIALYDELRGYSEASGGGRHFHGE